MHLAFRLLLDTLLLGLLSGTPAKAALTSSSTSQSVSYAAPDDCNVSCPTRNCRKRRGPNYVVTYVPGRCCPACIFDDGTRPVCDKVQCVYPSCDPLNQLVFKPPTRCCPVCLSRGLVGPNSVNVPPLQIALNPAPAPTSTSTTTSTSTSSSTTSTSSSAPKPISALVLPPVQTAPIALAPAIETTPIALTPGIQTTPIAVPISKDALPPVPTKLTSSSTTSTSSSSTSTSGSTAIPPKLFLKIP